eukprot:4677823-Amphidinium_carterae.1
MADLLGLTAITIQNHTRKYTREGTFVLHEHSSSQVLTALGSTIGRRIGICNVWHKLGNGL